MGIDPITLTAGGAILGSGLSYLNNQSARKDANKARKKSQAVQDRQEDRADDEYQRDVALREKAEGDVFGYLGSHPLEGEVQKYMDIIGKSNETDARNTGTALSTFGYNAQDSTAKETIGATLAAGKERSARAQVELPMLLLQQRLGLMAATDPGNTAQSLAATGAITSDIANSYDRLAALHLQQVTNPAAFIGQGVYAMGQMGNQNNQQAA